MFYPIQLDKMRNFRYGMKAISLIEKKLGKPIGKVDMENLTMEDAAVMIWAGLVHEDPELTPEKVMDLVDEYSDIQTVLTAMGEAFQGAFGGRTEKDALLREEDALLREVREEGIKEIKKILDESVKEARKGKNK